jgi:hypothetical protein
LHGADGLVLALDIFLRDAGTEDGVEDRVGSLRAGGIGRLLVLAIGEKA